MAASRIDKSLDTLQQMVNEVLVQTGKVFRHSSRDDQYGMTQVNGALSAKLPEIMQRFHYALDDIESEITRAKAVLTRDLAKQRVDRTPIEQAEPVLAQSENPMVIDIESPDILASFAQPPVSRLDSATTSSQKLGNTVAPFPDMGMPAAPASGAVEVSSPEIKNEKLTPAPQFGANAPVGSTPDLELKIESNLTAGAQATAPAEDSLDFLYNLPGNPSADHVSADAELNFTDMTFSLAETGQDSKAQDQTRQNAVDLDTFASTDGVDGVLNMDNLLPTGSETQLSQAEINEEKLVETKGDSQEPTNEDDIFALNAGSSVHNMDLDLDLGTGDGDTSTFDDLFFDTGDAPLGGVTDMEHGQFDDAYFGL